MFNAEHSALGGGLRPMGGTIFGNTSGVPYATSTPAEIQASVSPDYWASKYFNVSPRQAGIGLVGAAAVVWLGYMVAKKLK